MLQIGVGDQIDTNQLRAIASANQLYTVLVESNFTSLTDALTSKLVDILCNSQHSRILKKCIFFLRLFSPEVFLKDSPILVTVYYGNV